MHFADNYSMGVVDEYDDVIIDDVIGNQSNGSVDGHQSGAAGVRASNLVIKYVVVILYLVTFLFGITGNTLTIFVLLRNRKLKSAATCFILNLAVADDLFVACLPFMAYSTYARRWVFGMLNTHTLSLKGNCREKRLRNFTQN
jgi:hypothetical protein